MLVSVFALLLVFVPGFTDPSKTTRRWLDIGALSFQPSEIAKFALIVFLSASLAKRRGALTRYWKGLLPYMLVISALAGLIVIEPHMSGAVFIFAIGMCVLFAAGAKIWHFIATVAVVAPIGYMAFEYLPLPDYVMKRVDSFLNLGADALDKDWQVMQSLYAIGSGGLFGKGLTMSTQKFLYLPEPQNDFIFAILAEELGFFGAAVAIALFAVLLWRGVKVAMLSSEPFGCYLAVGITAHIVLQALANIAVVTASIPATGVSLPFFSYGGTSLCLFLAEVGILLNVSKSAHVDTVLPASELRAAMKYQTLPTTPL
jgi:cell division protein FtsW